MHTTLGERTDGRTAGTAAERRLAGRKAVLKRAQIVFGGAAVDCVVENMSDRGARVRFGGPIALPAELGLRFPDGATFAAERRWARGTAAGVRFFGPGPVAETGRRHMAIAIRGAVEALDPAGAVRLLEQVWFFGDERVRQAAEALQVAQARLAGALVPHLAERASVPSAAEAQAA